MRFAELGLTWQGVGCPYFVVNMRPGLRKASTEGTLGAISSPCSMRPYIETEADKIVPVAAPIPTCFPSDMSWWVDIAHIATVLAGIARVALDSAEWNGALTVGIAVEPVMRFRDPQGYWMAASHAWVLKRSALDELSSQLHSHHEWCAHLTGMLAAPNNVLLPASDIGGVPYDTEQPALTRCFQELLHP